MTATTMEVNNSTAPLSRAAAALASPKAKDLESHHDLFVCDKSTQATPSHQILTSDSQTIVESPRHAPPYMPQAPQASPASTDAALALSRLFHAQPPPPPYNPSHRPRPAPRSFSWGAPPVRQPQPPQPYYGRTGQDWQQRPYSSATNVGCHNAPGPTGVYEPPQYQPIFPSPGPNRSSSFFPPHPPPYQPPSNNFYYSYSPNANNKRYREHNDQHQQQQQRHLVTPTPKKMRMDGSPALVAAIPPPQPLLPPAPPPPPPQEEYSRKSKSLGLLCENFCKHDWQNGIGIDEAAKALGVERRRIYDIINILESLEVVQRKCKNRYHWLGFAQLPKVLAEIQHEGIMEARELAAEALELGIVKEDTVVETSSGGGDDKTTYAIKKSLGRLSRQFLQLYLVGNKVMSLMEASDRIMGKTEEPSSDLECPVERKAAVSKGQKTKIRRLYDIANVLASIGLVQKQEGEKRSRPTFSWIYHWTPRQIRALRTSPSSKSGAGSPQSTSKAVLAGINEHGAREPQHTGSC